MTPGCCSRGSWSTPASGRKGLRWHRAYNKSCINVLSGYKQSLAEDEEDHEITAANVSGVRTKLELWEDSTYTTIVGAGKAAALAQKAAAKINNVFKK
ncbi:hypothetical protein [Pyxidicoccus xibeiensis]|uniref:hypothetical protein n=1 Tax=Pyxidicoccus xibeiensis TaxID=2906759 RepID=UPI0020A7CF18|nr:hypothetical protein [Pyxidicoccus xibeiensis]MCP3144988.1 hypothetical protein [Pyxidicoccus xibeiensis]